MPAPSINLDIRDANQHRAFAPFQYPNLNQHPDSAYLGVLSDLPVTIQIQYPYLLSEPAFLTLYDHRRLYKSIFWHRTSHQSGQHKKSFSMEHLCKGRTHSLLAWRTSFPLLSSTRALFSMNARIAYHWEGSNGAVWWKWRRLDDAIFSCSGLTKSSVLSAILLLEGIRFRRTPLYFNSSSPLEDDELSS